MHIKIEYNLYQKRIEKGYTIRKLSNLSGVSKTLINNIENNMANPTMLTMCQLAVALNAKPEDLYSFQII